MPVYEFKKNVRNSTYIGFDQSGANAPKRLKEPIKTLLYKKVPHEEKWRKPCCCVLHNRRAIGWFCRRIFIMCDHQSIDTLLETHLSILHEPWSNDGSAANTESRHKSRERERVTSVDSANSGAINYFTTSWAKSRNYSYPDSYMITW